jgi:hypothetical protein
MLQRGSAAQTPAKEFAIEAAQGLYTLVVTTTFTAQPDPFALTAGGQVPAVLQIRMGSRLLLQKREGILPGRPMRVTLDQGLVRGTNELFIEASPPLDAADRAQAVRLQLLRDQLMVAQETFWAEPGETISTPFRFVIEERAKDTEHDH